jgi:hypothetical protein
MLSAAAYVQREQSVNKRQVHGNWNDKKNVGLSVVNLTI